MTTFSYAGICSAYVYAPDTPNNSGNLEIQVPGLTEGMPFTLTDIILTWNSYQTNRLGGDVLEYQISIGPNPGQSIEGFNRTGEISLRDLKWAGVAEAERAIWLNPYLLPNGVPGLNTPNTYQYCWADVGYYFQLEY